MRNKPRNWKTFLLTLFFVFSSLTVVPYEAKATADFDAQKPMRLYYDEEAPYGNEILPDQFNSWTTPENDGWERWSIPLGNGYMGVNVFGRTKTERLQITENSLSTPYYSALGGGLTNFAEVYMEFGHTNSQVTNYSRDLLLDEGTAHVNYTYNGVNYSRELFASYPDKVTVVKLTADQTGKIDFTLRPKIPFLEEFHVDSDTNAWVGKTGSVTAEGDTITLAGKFGAYEVQYEGQIKVIPTGGTVTAATDSDGNGYLRVFGADSAYVIIGVGTNYPVGDSTVFTANDLKAELAKYPAPHQKVTELMAAASGKSYEELLASHQADYKELFGRVKLDLNADDGGKTTDQLVNDYIKGNYSHYLESLYFQYGRYLLICSSRKGTLPPNLQGIWNRYKNPPWSAGYWHNINEQMNYWPVFNTNLAELFDCYIDYFQAYLPRAEQLAKNKIADAHPDNLSLSGGTGWSISTGAWPFTMSVPSGRGTDGNGTGALMAKSFSEYYAFTKDQSKLEEVLYPAVLGAAMFMTKVLEPHDGLLLADPSASPEQQVDGQYYVTVGTAWDQQNAYEMHKDAIAMAKTLGKENDPEIKMLTERMEKLDPVQVGASGQVKEFREENEYGELGEYNHRHISQLVGLYPGTLINETTPAWFDAAGVTMTERGDQSTGWAMAHRLNLWARTKRGERAYDLYRQLLRTGTNTNLWDRHPPFQIDGNFGGTAGVAEMLLQSHEGYMEPLAAIPAAWDTGSYSGLVARGNFEVAAAWSNGQMDEIRVTSKSGEQCRLKYHNIGKAKVTASDGSTVSVKKESGDIISFATKKGVSYTVSGIPSYTAVKAPGRLQASLDEDAFSMVQLSWKASAEEGVTYSVYCAEESEPNYTLIADQISDLSYTYQIPEESVGKQATYRVTAVKNGIESDGVAAVTEAVVIHAPKAVTGRFLDDTTLQVTVSAVEKASGYRLYEKRDGKWEMLQSSPYTTLVQNNAEKEVVYGVSAFRGKWESEIVEMALFSAASTELEDNILLHQTVTGTRSTLADQFSYDKVVDGDLSTRYAVSDVADPYSVTVQLDGTYLLNTLRIYEFKPSEGGTRSGNTKVEVKSGGSWRTVISGESLNAITANGQYTAFSLDNAVATELRITFENTSGNNTAASIWELQCSGLRLENTSAVDNVFLNQSITGTRGTLAEQYSFEKAVDGSLSTRYAVGDSADPYSVTVTLDGTYLLDTMKIYEYNETAKTRSGNTKVEAMVNGSWETVEENLALTDKLAEGTSIAMGGRPATAVRITFQNISGESKAATIREIQCSGYVLESSNKFALAQALLLASAVDAKALTEAQLTEWEKTLQTAQNVMNSERYSQKTVDAAAETLCALAQKYGAKMPEAPVAKNVKVTGKTTEYETLTAAYDFYDANGDREQDSRFIWETSEDGTEWKTLKGETGKSLTLPNRCVGRYVRVKVRACSDAEPSVGAYVTSDSVGPVAQSSDYKNFRYQRLLLEHTKTDYTAGSTGQVHVTGLSEQGGVYDLDGHSKIRYSSSDPLVAEVNASTGAMKLGRAGVATVTATFENADGTTAQGSAMVVVYKMPCNRQDFEGIAYNPAVDTHIGKVKNFANSGNYGVKISRYPKGSSSTQGLYNRVDIYRNTPYRAAMVLQGWFYDNGEEEGTDAALYFQSETRDETNQDQGYYTGMYRLGLQSEMSNQYYSVTSDASARTYQRTGSNWTGAGTVRRILDGRDGIAAVPRVKGWHQATFVSTGDTKNRFTDQGTVSLYLDGQLVFTERYVHASMNICGGIAAYELPGCSYYDDLLLCQNIAEKPVTVTYTVGGKVLVDGGAVTSGAIADFDVANGLTLTLQPEEGYAVGQVTVNGQGVIPQNDGTVFLSDITGETKVTVSFTDKIQIPPSVETNPSYNFFKTAEGQPTVFVYGKLNQFDLKQTFAYGIRIWEKKNPADVLVLPARNAEDGEPAAAVPGQAYAIRIYGPAIVPEDTYVVQPYVGDATGEEIELTYTE